MKKLRFLTLSLLAAGFAFLTSCQEDSTDPIGPSFTGFSETMVGITDGAIDAAPGQTLRFEWEVRRGDADLQTFEIRRDNQDVNVTTEGGEDIPYENISASDNEIYSDAVQIAVATAPGTYSYAFIVTDEDGLKSTKTVEVTVAPATTQLAASEAFMWKRECGAAGTGLDKFGLKWTNNTTTSAIVKKDAATKMVILQSSDWNNITTVEGLAAAITAGSDITQYDKVSVTAPTKTYDDVLGVMDGTGKVYMLHVTNSSVTTTGCTGGAVTVTIDGEYRAEP